MNDTTSETPIVRWAAVWVRADALRVNDRILVRRDDKDLWAVVTSIEPFELPDQLHLRLYPEEDGTSLGEHAHVTSSDTAFLRRLPGELSQE